MSNVIKFPRMNDTQPTGSSTDHHTTFIFKMLTFFVNAAWMLTVLCWPVIKWILAIVIVSKLFVVIWTWNTPGLAPMISLIIHVGVMVAASRFVTQYRP